VRRGQGIHGRKDGLCYKNVLATYSHLHAVGAKGWAKALLEQAIYYKRNMLLEQSMVVNETPVVTDISGTSRRVFSPEPIGLP